MSEISLFTSAKDNQPKPKDVRDLSDLAKLLREPVRHPDPFGGMDEETWKKAKSALPAWSPARYARGSKRGNANVVEVSFAVTDLDDVSEEIVEEILYKLTARGIGFLCHDSAGSVRCPSGVLRKRIIVALSHRIPGSDWSAAWPMIMEEIGVRGVTDQAAKDAARIYFRPAGDSRIQIVEGTPLDVSSVLTRIADIAAAPAAPKKEAPKKERESAASTENRYTNAALDKAYRALSDAPKGERHPVLVKEAYSLGGLIASGALQRSDVESIIERALGDAFDDDAKRTMKGQLDAGAAKPREVPEPQRRMQNSQPSNDVAKTYNQTDAGNAQRFRDEHGYRFRFCTGRGWLANVGSHWAKDDTGERFRAWKQTARRMLREANDLKIREDATPEQAKEDEARRRRAVAWALHSEQTSAIAATLKSAESEIPIATTLDAFDRDQLLFNALNCTVELRTGKSRLHAPEDMISKIGGSEYHADAKCPVFEAFLERIFAGDKDLIDFLQRFLGYCLTGDVREQVLAFFYGKGSNGKSTLIETLLAMAGDYAMAGAPGLLLAKKGETHPTEQADLLGARIVSCVEIGNGKRFDEERVKALTGGDKIKARYMREDFFSFSPTHKLVVAANHKPQVRGTDFAIWRRILLVPFAVTFTEAEKDPLLKEKLAVELPGILRWAVDGCLAWQKDGLRPPAIVTAATTDYRTEQDVVGRFLAERCNTDPLIADRLSTTASALYEAYTTWCTRTGEHSTTQRGFGDALSEKNFEHGKRNGKGKVTWQGIGLLADDSEQSEQSEGTFRMNAPASFYTRTNRNQGSEGSEGSELGPNRRAS